MKTIFLVALAVISLSLGISAQNTGSIRGMVIDEISGATIPGAHAFIKSGQNLIGTTSDTYGYFTLKPLDPGTYDVHVSFMGYGEQIITSVKVNAGQITFIEKVILVEGLRAPEFTMYGDPLINPDGGLDKILRSKQIEELPESRNLMKIITAIASDVTASDNERDFSFRGARVGDATMVVDGVNVRGNETGLPGGSISSVVVYTGGIPAKYGDTTGGVIVIQSKSYFEWEAEQRIKAH